MVAVGPPVLRSLLRRRDLRLRLVTAEGDLRPGTLDRPLRWVHSSDLADPTPFLADDLALLTTGTQFEDGDADGVEAYVGRLIERGVIGLGFGTEVQRQGIPDELVDSCRRAGIALFEVPYDTPFIAIARAHSEAIAAEAYARRTWALDTQRALAIAALRPHGLDATLTELARRLGTWVGMFDGTGALTHEHPRGTLAAADLDLLTARAGELAVRGGQVSQSLELAQGAATLFTVGRTHHLRGVIAIASAALDPESRAVITSVIAMAGLSLEQNEQVARSRRRLRSQLLASLLLDDATLARRVLGSLPTSPVVVAVADADAPAEAILEWWDRRRGEHDTALFAAESDDGLTLCISANDEPVLDLLAAHFDIRVGASAPENYSAFSRAHDQALTALRRAHSGVTRFTDLTESSILAALATDEARVLAESRLAPLRRHDQAHGAELERSLRVWLEHDARAEAAAAALGVHRHTLRARIAQAATLLDLDLSTFPARAELWAALHTARD